MGESTGSEAAALTLTPPPPPPAVGDLARRKQPCYSHASSSASAARESDAEVEKKQGRRKSRKRREAVARAIRDRLPAVPSCWGDASAVRQISRRNLGESPRGGDAVEEDDSGLGAVRRPPAWCCCVCLEEDCSLEPNPSANGKEDAGARSLIERNDFFSDDCNPHAAVAAAVATPVDCNPHAAAAAAAVASPGDCNPHAAAAAAAVATPGDRFD